MAEIFACGIALFIIGIFYKRPEKQKSQDLIIPIFSDTELSKEDCSNNASSDFDYEEYDTFDDFGG